MNVEVSIVRCYGGEDGEGMRLCVRAKGSRAKLVEVTISGAENIANLTTQRECEGVAIVPGDGREES
jgi:hypothetical protein